MRRQIDRVKNWSQFLTESRINNDSVSVGDNVSYEKEYSGFNIVQGHRLSKKTLEVGTVVEKIPSIKNMAPIFVIRNENGNIDEVTVGSVIEILKKRG